MYDEHDNGAGNACSILLSASRKLVVVLLARVTWDLRQMSPPTGPYTSIRSKLESECSICIFLSSFSLPGRVPRYNHDRPHDIGLKQLQYVYMVVSFHSSKTDYGILHCVLWMPWRWVNMNSETTAPDTKRHVGTSWKHRMTISDFALSLQWILRLQLPRYDAVCFHI